MIQVFLLVSISIYLKRQDKLLDVSDEGRPSLGSMYERLSNEELSFEGVSFVDSCFIVSVNKQAL